MSTINLASLKEAEFVARYGALYEHSPWIAQSAWKYFSSQDSITIDALKEQLKTVVQNASKDQQLDLLNEHPELAGKAAINGELTAESTEEQACARLDLCTQVQFDRFHELNTQYNEKFGFPFILAVRGRSRVDILAAFEKRINNSVETEFDMALEQVHQIASLRLDALVNQAS